jgi:hypothetical protein
MSHRSRHWWTPSIAALPRQWEIPPQRTKPLTVPALALTVIFVVVFVAMSWM